MTKKNEYKKAENYYIGYTYRHKNEFYFDEDDYKLVSKYFWKKDSKGNIYTNINGKKQFMHSLIMEKGIYKHINENNFDNRKENLCHIKGYKNEGKTFLNGYIAIYMPEHKMAFKNGCIYEHVLVAEKMLGRELYNDECVHHIDRNRTNNSENNLMVFKTKNDHALYHAGCEAIQLDDGSYICKNEIKIYHEYNNRTRMDIDNGIIDCGSIIVYKDLKNKYNLCPICKKELKSYDAKMCLQCWKKERKKNIPSKAQLEKLIYDMSFVKIGDLYGVTDNAVRKWCKQYNLPFRKKDMKCS